MSDIFKNQYTLYSPTNSIADVEAFFNALADLTDKPYDFILLTDENTIQVDADTPVLPCENPFNCIRGSSKLNCVGVSQNVEREIFVNTDTEHKFYAAMWAVSLCGPSEKQIYAELTDDQLIDLMVDYANSLAEVNLVSDGAVAHINELNTEELLDLIRHTIEGTNYYFRVFDYETEGST